VHVCSTSFLSFCVLFFCCCLSDLSFFLSFCHTCQTLRENAILRRYHISKREDYHKYNRIVGQIQKTANKLKKLDPKDPYRIETTTKLLEKLFNMGVVNAKNSLAVCEKVSASSFCRRRLPIIMVRLKMSETVREAVTLLEQGHVRVGPQVVTDPAFLVTRTLEDFVTWVDGSKIRRTIMKYNDRLDDYDLLGN
jgi:U3 small nucleolar ribonucleoprotein protein IMP3